MTVNPSLAPLVAEVARKVVRDSKSSVPNQINEGATLDSQEILAPARYATVELLQTRMTPQTLEITRHSDGHVYRPGIDYTQTSNGFDNIRIPQSQRIVVQYMYEDFLPSAHTIIVRGKPMRQRSHLEFDGLTFNAADDAAEDTTKITVLPQNTPLEVPTQVTALLNGWTATGAPHAPVSYYKDRERCHVSGRITAGTITTGTVLFSVASGYNPRYLETFAMMSDAGPVMLSVSPTDGDVAIAAGPFAAGATWISLDGLSWRVKSAYGPRYPNANRYPNTNRYPNGIS